MQSLPKSGLAKETHDASQSCGNLKWVNSKTLEELYFISATVACGQLQQRSVYPNNVVYLVILPAWRTSGEVAPVDGYQKMAPGSASGWWRHISGSGR